MAAEALRAALRLLPRLPLHEAGSASSRVRQPRFLEQLLHGPGSHSKGRGVFAVGSGSRGAKAGAGLARLARTMLAYFGAGTFVLVGVGGQTVHASCRDNSSSKGSPSCFRAAAADVRNRWHRHRSQVCQEEITSSLRSSSTSSPPPLSPLFSPAWFPPTSKPQDAPPQAVLSRINSWEVLEVAPATTGFPSLQWDLSPAAMDSRPRSWIEPAITGQSPSGLGLLMQGEDVPNLEPEPRPLDDAEEMADVKGVGEALRKVEHTDITGNSAARAASDMSIQEICPALRVEVASTSEGSSLNHRGDIVEESRVVRGGLSARLSRAMGEEKWERDTGEVTAAADEGPDGHWSMHAQWTSSRREEPGSKYRPFNEASSLRESVLLFGEALCHSQTRAREAEEAVKATAAENKHLKRMLEYEAGRAYTYQLWAATVEVENGLLRRTSNTAASALGKPSSTCKSADPVLNRIVKKKLRSEAGEQETLLQRPCKRRRKGKVEHWSDQVVFSCTMIVATGALIAGAAIFVGWKLGWIVWTKKCWFLL